MKALVNQKKINLHELCFMNMFGQVQKLIATSNLIKIKTSLDIFSIKTCKVTFGFKCSTFVIVK